MDDMTTYYVVRVDGNSSDAEAAPTLTEAIDRCFVDEASVLEYTQVEACDRHEAVEVVQSRRAGWKVITLRNT